MFAFNLIVWLAFGFAIATVSGRVFALRAPKNEIDMTGSIGGALGGLATYLLAGSGITLFGLSVLSLMTAAAGSAVAITILWMFSRRNAW